MSDPQSSPAKRWLVPLVTALLTIAAILGVSQLSTNVSSGAAPKPQPKHQTPVASAPANTVTTNRNPDATKAYWTRAKMSAAEEVSLVRTDASDMSHGTSNLDFTRSRITPQTANLAAPYRSVGKIFFTEPGVGDFQCSGSIIAKRIVITAAHCVYGGGFYTNWVFIPGYDGSKPTLATQRPLGTWTWASAEVPLNWIDTGGSLPNDTDFAAIVFADQSFNGAPAIPLFKKAGKFVSVTNHLADTAVTMLGYPCNLDSCNIMQRVDTSDHRVPPGTSGSNAVEYGSDMTGGSSGGPWVENFGNPLSAAPTGSSTTRNAVVAVTSYGYTDGGSALVLGASNLDSRWTTIFSNRCAAAVGNC